MPRVYTKLPLETRFWSKVTKRSSSCWSWTGSKDQNGYGRLGLRRTGGTLLAHRVSWTIHNGEIPKGMFVLHACDTPECTNPDHLFIGDQKANMADCARKGRTAYGERQGSSKLTEAQVLAIKATLGVSQYFTQARIAKMFGVSQSQVSNIARGKHWVRAENKHTRSRRSAISPSDTTGRS